MRSILVPLIVALLTACDTGSVVLQSPESQEGGGDAGPGGGGGDSGGGGQGLAYHPSGFGSPALHGLEFNLQDQDCRSCHGSDLSGLAPAPSCDSCHSAAAPLAWRSDCTFCHGDTPENLDGSLVGGFAQPHLVHLATTMTGTIACSGCHDEPTDVLSPGHAFDSSPGAAEVAFDAALNPAASFANATCSNNYCHGDGRGDNGNVAISAPAMNCESCHAGPASGSTAWSTMSGEHRRHLDLNGVTCADCHSEVTSDGLTLSNALLHIDGNKQVASALPGFTITPQAGQVRCTGACHGDNHQNEGW